VGRRLGQHFLVRESILERIAVAACGERVPSVVEIGPGKGALTRHLLNHADRVIAVEVDPYLTHYLRQKFKDSASLDIVDADVLKTDLGQWGSTVIAGNLPYYITSPILERVISLPAGAWTRAVFLVQKEVAERLSAEPGTRDFGFLTVQVALFCRVEYLFTVSPAAFSPPPKVDSAVVRLTPRDVAADWGVSDPARFLRFASAAFQQKRKTLRNNLRGIYPAIDGAPEAGERAEQLNVAQLVDLHRRLAGS
jgi:16S rRNA (adenine1518-N6/adenine1519-N6)-dimethyltransferase